MRQERNQGRIPTDIEGRYAEFKNHEIKKIKFDYPRQQIIKLDRKSEKQYIQIGQSVLKLQKVALIIFAGGMGNRAGAHDGKQFISFNKSTSLRQSTQNFECLFDLLYQKTIKKIIQKQCQTAIYILCNRANRNTAFQRIQQLQKQYLSRQGSHYEPQIYFCFQQERPLLNKSGNQTIYNKKNQKLLYPNGAGRFLQSKLYFQESQTITLRQHLSQILQPKYVYGIGISNLMEKGIQNSLIGYLQKHEQNIDMVFKCVQPEYLDIPYNRIVHRITNDKDKKKIKKQWIIMQYANLHRLSNRIEIAQKAPVWCDNFVIKCDKLVQQDNYQPLIKYQYLSRILKNRNGQKIPIIVAQYLLSNVIMKSNINCQGIQFKQKSWKPLITDHDFQNAESLVGSLKRISLK